MTSQLKWMLITCQMPICHKGSVAMML